MPVCLWRNCRGSGFISNFASVCHIFETVAAQQFGMNVKDNRLPAQIMRIAYCGERHIVVSCAIGVWAETLLEVEMLYFCVVDVDLIFIAEHGVAAVCQAQAYCACLVSVFNHCLQIGCGRESFCHIVIEGVGLFHIVCEKSGAESEAHSRAGTVSETDFGVTPHFMVFISPACGNFSVVVDIIERVREVSVVEILFTLSQGEFDLVCEKPFRLMSILYNTQVWA